MLKEGDKSELEILSENNQDRYFQQLDRINKDNNKTLRTFIICICIVITVWIIGAFMINVYEINQNKSEVSVNVWLDKKDIISICNSSI